MRLALHILLLIALTAVGCRREKETTLLGEPEPPVIQPTVNNDPVEPGTATIRPENPAPTVAAPREPEPSPVTETENQPAPSPGRTLAAPPRQDPDTTLSSLVAVRGEDRDRDPVGLIALDDNNLHDVRAEPENSAPASPATDPASPPPPSMQPRPRLAPLPGLAEAPEPEPAGPAASNKPQPAPAVKPDKPAPARSTTTESLRSGLEDSALDRATAAPVPPEPTVAEDLPAAGPTPAARQARAEQADENVVLGREVVVAGTTLQVNEQHVSVDDILAALHNDLVKIPKNVPEKRFRQIAERTIAQEMLSEIKRILVATEAAKLLEDHVIAEVDKEMAETRRELIAKAGSEEQFKQKCLRDGTTAQAVFREHRRQLLIQIYMRQKFYPAIVITRRMLWDYYRRHPEQFSQDKQVQTQQIAAPVRSFLPARASRATKAELAAARRAARKHIEKARDALQDGRDFADVAQEFSKGPRASKGGLWPMYPKGNLAEEKVEAAAFELAEGQVSDIIETDRGFYLVRAAKVQPGQVTPFEQAQTEIVEALRKEQFQQMQSEYMNKLYERSTVSQPQGFVELAVDKALRYYRHGETPPVPAGNRYDYLGNRKRREDARRGLPGMGIPTE